MACCILGALLVYQLTEAWRRLRAFCGLSVDGAPSTSASFSAWVRRCLRKPLIRSLVIAVLCLETGIALGWAYEHREHVAEEVRRLAGNSPGSSEICTSSTDRTP